MGDSKAATASSGRVVGSAPRVAARRSTRFTTRASARSLQSVRAPIVLELGSNVIRVGYADGFQPQHLISVPTQNMASSAQHYQTEPEWYAILNPWIEAVYDRLLCNPTTRKVVVLHPQQVVPEAWQAALEQIFWNKGVPAVTFVSALEILPVAQGWKRGLIVHVSREEAVCVCHADGHVLPFTFQSIPECGYQHLLKDPSKLSREWTAKIDRLILDELHNPNSLVVALLKCLEACPRDIRYDVIHNLVFCGDGLVILPDLGRRVAQRLEQILEGNQPELQEGASSEVSTGISDMTAVPVSVKNLESLATRLRMISCAPYRPDTLGWVACSLWAATWNRYEDDESRISWKSAPQES